MTVFDAYEAPGGILRYGIPGYRLPDAVVDVEIAALQRSGVRFEVGARVGDVRDARPASLCGTTPPSWRSASAPR